MLLEARTVQHEPIDAGGGGGDSRGGDDLNGQMLDARFRCSSDSPLACSPLTVIPAIYIVLARRWP